MFKYYRENKEKKYIFFISENINNEYVKKRISNLLCWYTRKATKNKFFFFLSLNTLTVLSPFFIGAFKVCTSGEDKVFIVLLLASALASINAFFNFKENWIRYRFTAEIIKSEVYKYQTKSGAYIELDEEKSICKLAEVVEDIVNNEVNDWYKIKNENSLKDKSLNETNNNNI